MEMSKIITIKFAGAIERDFFTRSKIWIIERKFIYLHLSTRPPKNSVDLKMKWWKRKFEKFLFYIYPAFSLSLNGLLLLRVHLNR